MDDAGQVFQTMCARTSSRRNHVSYPLRHSIVPLLYLVAWYLCCRPFLVIAAGFLWPRQREG